MNLYLKMYYFDRRTDIMHQGTGRKQNFINKMLDLKLRTQHENQCKELEGRIFNIGNFISKLLFKSAYFRTGKYDIAASHRPAQDGNV